MCASRWARCVHRVPQGLFRVGRRGDLSALCFFMVTGFTVTLCIGDTDTVRRLNVTSNEFHWIICPRCEVLTDCWALLRWLVLDGGQAELVQPSDRKESTDINNKSQNQMALKTHLDESVCDLQVHVLVALGSKIKHHDLRVASFERTARWEVNREKWSHLECFFFHFHCDQIIKRWYTSY